MGFIVELINEKKKCVDAYLFIMKISKYLERIYMIMDNKYNIGKEKYELFGTLNNLRKNKATLNNNTLNSTKKL